MADKKISNLPAAAALSGSEAIPLVQSGATKKSTPDAIVDYVKSEVVSGSITNGVTDQAPSEDAVFDALAGKSNTGHTHVAADTTDFNAAAQAATIAQAITNGVTDKAPSEDAVFDALAGKSNTGHTHVAADTTDFNAAAQAATIAQAITNGVVDKAPSEDAVFDALAGKSNTGHTHVAADVTDFAAAAQAASIAQAITNGVTDKAPSEDVVFDALALKANKSYVDTYYVGPNSTYTTIQAALTAIGNGTTKAQLAAPQTVIIEGGVYDEDLTIPTGRIVTLLAKGTVLLGNALGADGVSTNNRSITYTPTNAGIAGWGVSGAPGWDLVTCLNVGVMNSSDATSGFIAEAGCFFISGDLIIAAAAGHSHVVNLYGVKLKGPSAGRILKTGGVGAGFTNLQMYRSYVAGVTSIADGATILERAQDCQFDGLISVTGYNSFLNCEIKGGMTVTANQNTMPPSGMFLTTFTGVFTGPAGSVKLDPVSNYFFIANGATLAGGATKVLLSDAVATIVSQTITNGVTDKSPSEDAVFDALAAISGGASNIDGLTDGKSDATNVFLGATGGAALTTGTANTSVGVGALDVLTSGVQNTAVGKDALGANTTQSRHTAIGFEAMLSMVNGGSDNVAIGVGTMRANTGSTGVVGIGNETLLKLTSGSENVAVGNNAMHEALTSIRSTAIGASALYSATGSENTAVGSNAGQGITSGSGNVAMGFGALFNTSTPIDNTAIGNRALFANTTGAGNVAIGANALDANTTAANNTAVGKNSLGANTTGTRNTALGSTTDSTGTTNTDNVSVGFEALKTNTGSRNVMIGSQGLGNAAVTGGDNVGMGHQALQATTSGDHNTAIGGNALAAVTTGIGNTGLGHSAGTALTTGTLNTIIGYTANTGANNLTNATAIGNGATVAASNTMQFGDVNVTDVYFSNSDAILHGDGSMLTNLPGGGATAINGLTDAKHDGSSNLILGHEGTSITSGVHNTMVGSAAGSSITSGTGNTAIGSTAGTGVLTTGTKNIMVGRDAYASSTGTYNTTVGTEAGGYSTGSRNTSIGGIAGDQPLTGSNNTFIGYDTGSDSDAATNRTAIGSGATSLVNNSVQIGNTSVTDIYFGDETAILHGDGSMLTNLPGGGGGATEIDGLTDAITDYANGNLSMGEDAGQDLLQDGSALNNVAIGKGALMAGTDAAYTVVVGAGSLPASLHSPGNTVVGAGSLLLLTAAVNDGTDGYNTAVGSGVLPSLTLGAFNTVLGASALYNQTIADNNIAVGYFALSQILTGGNNIGIGNSVGGTLTTGTGNILIGHSVDVPDAATENYINIGNALKVDSDKSNALLGSNAGNLTMTGVSNVAVGDPALFNNTTGTRNVAIGALNTMTTNSSGSYNTAVGSGAMQTNNGDFNTGIGVGALANCTTGSQNVVVGNCGQVIETGTLNVVIGQSAEVSAEAAANQIVIGAGAIGQADNTAQIGNDSITDVYFGDGSAVLHGDGSMLTGVGGGGAFSGARVNFDSGDQSIPDATNTAITWENAQFDVDDWWNVSDPTIFTVPSGVNYVRINCQLLFLSMLTGKYADIRIYKNGTDVYEVARGFSNGVDALAVRLSSEPIACAPGDEFEIQVYHNNGLAVTCYSGSGQYPRFAVQKVG